MTDDNIIIGADNLSHYRDTHHKYAKKLDRAFYSYFSRKYKALDKGDLKALAQYKGGDYMYINRFVNGDKFIDHYTISLTSKTKNMRIFDDFANIFKLFYDIHTKLDRVISSLKLPRDMIVYRGERNLGNMRKSKIGDTFKYNTYISTSLTPIVANKFLYDSGGIIMAIKLRKDMNVAYLPWELTYGLGENDGVYTDGKSQGTINKEEMIMSEMELLLPRGITLKLVEKKDIKGYMGKRDIMYVFSIEDVNADTIPKFGELDKNNIMTNMVDISQEFVANYLLSAKK